MYTSNEGGRGGAYSFLACFSHLTIDHRGGAGACFAMISHVGVFDSLRVTPPLKDAASFSAELYGYIVLVDPQRYLLKVLYIYVMYPCLSRLGATAIALRDIEKKENVNYPENEMGATTPPPRSCDLDQHCTVHQGEFYNCIFLINEDIYRQAGTNLPLYCTMLTCAACLARGR